jgi:hypothetical protein
VKKLFLIVFVFSIANVFAQDIDSYIELLRSDIKTEKKAIITEVMEFTEEQSEAFWPIYREFEFELDKLADARLANIKEFAKNYENLTDEKADKLINVSFDFQGDRLNLNEKYYNKFAEVLSPTVAAKYMQLEHEIQLLIDIGISSNLPLAKKPGSK